MKMEVELNTELNRIMFTSEYYAGVAQDCKSVSGYKWHPDMEGKPWSYPLRMQVCHALRKTFGPDLTIGPKLTQWARKQSKLYAEQRSLALKPDSDLALVKESHPLFWEAMSARPYQRSGAQFLAMTGHAADFSEPGLGKTATSLAALIQAGAYQDGRHLVIVSNKTAIRSTWKHEIHKWVPDAKVYAMPDGRAKREAMMDAFWDDEEGARFCVILPNMLQIKMGHYCKKCKIWQEEADDKKFVEVETPAKHYEESHKWTFLDYKLEWPEFFTLDDDKTPFEWDSIIADECHDYLLKLRDPRSTNQPQWANGMRRLQIRQGGVKLPMTGTPMRGKEVNLYGIMYWVDPIRWPSFWGWANAYFDVVETGYNRVVQRLRPEMEAAFYDVLDSFALRRTRAEVRKDLPEQLPQEHWVPLEGEHARQYQEFEEEGIAALESGVIEGLGRLSEMTRLRQFAFGPHDVEYSKRKPKWPKDAEGMEYEQFLQRVEEGWMIPVTKMVPLVGKSPKVALMMDMLNERGALDGSSELKYVIASQYTRVIDELVNLFTTMKVPTLKITGGVSASLRDHAVNTFQDKGGPPILLLNTKAGGASLTLDRYCDEMFILDETWIHDDQVQLMGRINNRGARVATRIYHFFRTEETIDEGIALNNDDQNSIQAQVLDSRRGNTVALSLIKRRRE